MAATFTALPSLGGHALFRFPGPATAVPQRATAHGRSVSLELDRAAGMKLRCLQNVVWLQFAGTDAQLELRAGEHHEVTHHSRVTLQGSGNALVAIERP